MESAQETCLGCLDYCASVHVMHITILHMPMYIQGSVTKRGKGPKSICCRVTLCVCVDHMITCAASYYCLRFSCVPVDHLLCVVESCAVVIVVIVVAVVVGVIIIIIIIIIAKLRSGNDNNAHQQGGQLRQAVPVLAEPLLEDLVCLIVSLLY